MSGHASSLRKWVGTGRPPTKTRLVAGEPGPVAVQTLATQLPDSAWQALSVAQGTQEARSDQFAAQQLWEHGEGVPGRACWLVWRRTLDGSALNDYFSNAPADTALLTRAQGGAIRWVIATEFQTDTGDAGLDEHEARSWQSWYHHITLALLASAVLLTREQDWGEKDAPHHPTSGERLRHLLPQCDWTLGDLQRWLTGTQQRNQRSKRRHAKRRRTSRDKPSLEY